MVTNHVVIIITSRYSYIRHRHDCAITIVNDEESSLTYFLFPFHIPSSSACSETRDFETFFKCPSSLSSLLPLNHRASITSFPLSSHHSWPIHASSNDQFVCLFSSVQVHLFFIILPASFGLSSQRESHPRNQKPRLSIILPSLLKSIESHFAKSTRSPSKRIIDHGQTGTGHSQSESLLAQLHLCVQV